MMMMMIEIETWRIENKYTEEEEEKKRSENLSVPVPFRMEFAIDFRIY